MDTQSLNEDQQQQLLMMMLIQQHQQIAMIGLGKQLNPATNTTEKDLPSAKFAIDMLTAVDKFTSGNLPDELKGYLTQTLTTLRLNYADVIKDDSTSKNGAESDNSSESDA